MPEQASSGITQSASSETEVARKRTQESLYFESHSDRDSQLKFTLLSGVVTPLVVMAITLFMAAWQFKGTNDRSDQQRFIDGAQATAQETSVLLDEGYIALDKLLNATGSDGWKSFSAGAFHDYMEFHRLWRQKLVSEHFKLTRYFGQDLADQLIHVDEIDRHPVDNLRSTSPCTPRGSEANFDIEKLSFQTWCTITRIPLIQDVIDAKGEAKSGNDLFDALEERREVEDFARKLLHHYDKAMVGYFRQLNERLTQLGQPQVTVLTRMAGK